MITDRCSVLARHAGATPARDANPLAVPSLRFADQRAGRSSTSRGAVGVRRPRRKPEPTSPLPSPVHDWTPTRGDAHRQRAITPADTARAAAVWL